MSLTASRSGFRPSKRKSSESWSEAYWTQLEQETSNLASAAPSERVAWEIITRQSRLVLRTYSSSFFIVTRFLPPAKRAKVEVIYAAVRYPDEIVDTFPLTAEARTARIDRWAEDYERGLAAPSIKEGLRQKVPSFLAAFTSVVRETGIPREYYISFLTAMRRDVRPRCFNSLDDLIESYVYGSAIVVGYFLAYVYGSSSRQDFYRAMASARHLGIALQLTNFLRDVAEDQGRGRLYLPMDALRVAGIDHNDLANSRHKAALRGVLRTLARTAEDHYARSLADLDAFALDCQTAIRASINVYRQLNQRISSNSRGIEHRESVPALEKFKVLPASKYWRVPLAYLGR